jgi:hypothetical protein
MEISKKAFIVTGAASGLGEATARMIVARGGSVILADINPACTALATELGPAAHFIPTDVTSEADGICAVESAKEKFGALHGLVNCAGIAPSERIAGRNGPHSLESFTRAVTINLIGTFNMLRLAATAMTANEPMADGERGIIVNTASVTAFEGQIGQAAYASDCLFLSRDWGRIWQGKVRVFSGMGDLSSRCIWRTGSRHRARSRLLIGWMSRNRLFLDGLVSTRAHLRFTGWFQYALQGSCGQSHGVRLKSCHPLSDFSSLGIEPYQQLVRQGDADHLWRFAGGAEALLEGDEVRLVTAHHAGHDEQDFADRSASSTHDTLALVFARVVGQRGDPSQLGDGLVGQRADLRHLRH